MFLTLIRVHLRHGLLALKVTQLVGIWTIEPTITLQSSSLLSMSCDLSSVKGPEPPGMETLKRQAHLVKGLSYGPCSGFLFDSGGACSMGTSFLYGLQRVYNDCR